MSLIRIAKICNIGIFFGILVSCAITINEGKFAPEFKGVDPQLQAHYDEWMDLAKQYGLEFKGTVTAGIKDIDKGSIVGICHRSFNFREIDIDRAYWKYSSEMSKTAMLWHELAHCYCGRSHDYGQGKEYPSLREIEKSTVKKDGYFADGCPLSLMYPAVVEDECFMYHYQGYVDEIFQRCEPY